MDLSNKTEMALFVITILQIIIDLYFLVRHWIHELLVTALIVLSIYLPMKKSVRTVKYYQGIVLFMLAAASILYSKYMSVEVECYLTQYAYDCGWKHRTFSLLFGLLLGTTSIFLIFKEKYFSPEVKE